MADEGKLSRRTTPGGAAPFERALSREIQLSERLRATVLAFIPSAALIVFLSLTAVYPELTHRLFRGEMDRVRVGLFLSLVALYEFYTLRQAERLARTGGTTSALRRYANAFIEVSLPTLVIAYYFVVVTPIEALLLPPANIYFVFILLSTLRLDFALCVFTGAVAAAEYFALALYATTDAATRPDDGVLSSTQHHLGKALVLLVSGIAAGLVARQLRRGFENTFRSMEERGRILNVFGQHVSPAVADRLLAQTTKSELREVCVMFLDIRDFTRFSARRSPGEIVEYLNSVFGFMVDIVNAHHGIVNKFLGDGFMAVFGAPIDDDAACRHAVEAATAIVRELEERVARGEVQPTAVGIGLHAGPAVIGNVGSGRRKEYTVIGDVVNVASRVEALNKSLSTHVLATEAVWTAAALDEPREVPHEAVAIRGRDEPIVVYKLG